MNIVFMGTPQFAVPTLQTLIDADDINILGIITQPDRPSGRGKKLTPPPVKLLGELHNIPIFQPERLRKDEMVMQWLDDQAPDFIVTIAFGQILPKRVLDAATFGTVNVHASLLPAYRGANPIQWSVLKGDSTTGLTTMFSDEGLDTGAMLLKKEITIEPDETMGELTERLSLMGGELLLKTLRGVMAGGVQPVAQDESLVSHAPKLQKTDAAIDWTASTDSILNRIRGLSPWPGALSQLNGEDTLKLGTTTLFTGDAAEESKESLKGAVNGQILAILKEGIFVKVNNDTLCIQRLQPPSKPMMNAADWARNAIKTQLETGSIFRLT